MDLQREILRVLEQMQRKIHLIFYKIDGSAYSGSIEEQVLAWAKDREGEKACVVQQDTLPNGIYISTVWIGIAQNMLGGEPLIFESMVFDKKHAQKIFEKAMYSTLGKAKEGHKVLIKKYRKRK